MIDRTDGELDPADRNSERPALAKALAAARVRQIPIVVAKVEPRPARRCRTRGCGAREIKARGTAGCCARAARGQAAILPPINVMNSRRLTGYPLRPGPYLTTSQVALCVTAKSATR